MKKAFLLFIVCFSFHILHAQNISDVGKLPLAIIMPVSDEEPSATYLRTLHIKVAQIVTASGLASDCFTPTFAIFPTLTITESKIAEGGMENITLVTAELTFFIKETDNNTLIASTIKRLKGSGKSEEAAVLNAINSISASDIDYKIFIESSKEKIVEYYNSRCEQMMTMADNMVAQQNYEGALGVLMSIPMEAKACYKNAQAKATEVYKSYQNKECATIILNAKAKIAATDYTTALELLTTVDPLSPCSKEANELIKNTGKKVDAQQKKEWDIALKIYDDQVSMENHRIDAIKEIAIAYYTKRRNSPSKKKYTEE